MANVLSNIPDNVAASMLRAERAKLEQTLTEQLNIIRAAQRVIDTTEQRLREVEQGERVLSRHG